MICMLIYFPRKVPFLVKLLGLPDDEWVGDGHGVGGQGAAIIIIRIRARELQKLLSGLRPGSCNNNNPDDGHGAAKIIIRIRAKWLQ